MSFQMDCEYCCKPWAEGHACVGSDLAKLLAKRDAEIERMASALRDLKDHSVKQQGEIERLRAENLKLLHAIQAYTEIEKNLGDERMRLREALEFIVTGPERDDGSFEAHYSNQMRLRAAVNRARTALEGK